MSKFKGTKGECNLRAAKSTDKSGQPLFFDICVGHQHLASIHANEYLSTDIHKAKENAKLIADAGNVRQQIDFDLPELLERYKQYMIMMIVAVLIVVVIL